MLELNIHEFLLVVRRNPVIYVRSENTYKVFCLADRTDTMFKVKNIEVLSQHIPQQHYRPGNRDVSLPLT